MRELTSDLRKLSSFSRREVSGEMSYLDIAMLALAAGVTGWALIQAVRNHTTIAMVLLVVLCVGGAVTWVARQRFAQRQNTKQIMDGINRLLAEQNGC